MHLFVFVNGVIWFSSRNWTAILVVLNVGWKAIFSRHNHTYVAVSFGLGMPSKRSLDPFWITECDDDSVVSQLCEFSTALFDIFQRSPFKGIIRNCLQRFLVVSAAFLSRFPKTIKKLTVKSLVGKNCWGRCASQESITSHKNRVQ